MSKPVRTSRSKAVAADTSGSVCWTRHQTNTSCDQLTFTWASDAVDGGYWDPDTHNVVLAADDAGSKHTILHEAGHWLHFQLYNHSFPDAPNCENHTFDIAGSKGCAWTEAFADAVAAYVLGDYRYVYSDGKSFDLHNDRNSAWDKGDAAQASPYVLLTP
ncbi:hypothetical protein QMK19_24785 [Streptomyces sp. H10-C2]|uniref:hypothetical protein n=1 Tax=unclassified Streptomyces TaxID=2593676 RepID=UPI0024BB8E26|nr:MULTISPECIES: hypothetical protein [unclassified Streptomyces]MDJ0343033.1 hypothetical protein [Streptomyces sp. PH10-H1]MDJ0372787.1 hypothetical protein [Streptomyces sp. H10-C2]